MNITIHLLPVYYPSADEASDPQLYCENVQSLISEESGIPISPFFVENGLVKGWIIIPEISLEFLLLNL